MAIDRDWALVVLTIPSLALAAAASSLSRLCALFIITSLKRLAETTGSPPSFRSSAFPPLFIDPFVEIVRLATNQLFLLSLSVPSFLPSRHDAKLNPARVAILPVPLLTELAALEEAVPFPSRGVEVHLREL